MRLYWDQLLLHVSFQKEWDCVGICGEDNKLHSLPSMRCMWLVAGLKAYVMWLNLSC